MALDIVLGSGPSGVAAASALRGRGREVLMLDAGTVMEERSQALRARLAATGPELWNHEDVAAVTEVRRSENTDGIRPFGSDFLFRPPPGVDAWGVPDPVSALRASFARGGLSNGWGASATPYRAEDIAAWPIGIEDLAPHYVAASKLAGVTARNDDLAGVFPVPGINVERSLPLSVQANALLTRMALKRSQLARLGVSFGQSRQAVSEGCRLCAMCLYGCPYGVIFNSSNALDQLLAAGGITYRSGVYATGISESEGSVRVHSTCGDFEGGRLYVACGVLPTAMLMLRTLGLRDQALPLLDSQHFYLPMLHGWAVPDPSAEPRHTLAQVFWELINPEVDPHTVHVQLYMHNDTYAPDMRRRFGPLAGLMEPAIRALSNRLIVAQTFLHSDSSPHMELRLAGPAGNERLVSARKENGRTAGAIARARALVARVARMGGMLPLTPIARMGKLGSSFHCGGSFPMSSSPDRLQSDVLGRPAGMKRVHLVDASVFPTIPATTITLSVMANAHRIASQS